MLDASRKRSKLEELIWQMSSAHLHSVHRKLPPLRSLHAFEAAAWHRSFKAAAAELGVTPTAISHRIRLLEETCGQKLFQRRPRPLALTSAGAQLFPALRNGFDALASAVASIAATAHRLPCA